ncbi:MAG: lipase family protein [Sporichthyaceae bacterium]
MRGSPTRTGPARALAAAVATMLVFATGEAFAGTDPGLPNLPDTVAAELEFYRPPDPLPKGRPGDVIRSEELAASAYPNARARRIMYLSRNYLGEPVAVTGLLLIPAERARGEASPLVVHTPGTRGLGDHCAPSKQADAATASPWAMDYSSGEYAQFLARGISVVITDYLGQGTPGIAPQYVVGPTAGYNGLDAVRAAQRIGGSGVSATSPVGISGYSQGGQAAAWTAQLQPTYAPELRLKGVLAGGVPTDVAATVKHIDGNPTAGAAFALASMLGLDAAHPTLDLEKRLTPAGRRIMQRIASTCVYEYLSTYGTINSTDVTSPNVLTDPAWLEAYERSRLGRRAPGAPAYLYHGTADTIVPFGEGNSLFHSWCRLGQSVQFEPLHGLDHLSGVSLGPPRGIAWLTDRLTGAQAPSGCHVVGLA